MVHEALGGAEADVVDDLLVFPRPQRGHRQDLRLSALEQSRAMSARQEPDGDGEFPDVSMGAPVRAAPLGDEAATTRSRSLSFSSCCQVGLTTRLPLTWPIRTAPIGPSNGISEMERAAEAPAIARITGSFS